MTDTKEFLEFRLNFWNKMLREAMLVEGKHWPEDYINVATNMLKNDGKYAGGKTDADVQKIAQRFRMVLHGNAPLGYFNTVVRWYSEDPDGFVKPLLGNGQVPNDKLESVLQQLLNFLNNQALVDKYSAQVKSGMSLSDFSSMMKKVSDEDKARADNAEFEVKDNGYQIIPFMSYEDLHEKFGGDKTGYKGESEWCHTNGESTYDSWTENFKKFFFVITKNNWESIKPHDNPQKTDNAYDEYGLSLMAILVSREGELLKCTLRWNHVVEPKYAKQGRAVDKAFISFAELSQVTGIDVKAEIKKELVKILEYVKRIPNGEKVYDGPEGLCFARDHFYWYDRDLNPIDTPDEIDGSFACYNTSITSLEGSPKIINGFFNCSDTGITSLEGGPQVVTKFFVCDNTNITSLEGAPREVGEYFQCIFSNITSLKDGPEKVGGSFYCNNTKLTSLEGAPNKLNGNFNCSYTNITSLEGAPREVGGFFQCSDCKFLKSLKGAPAKIKAIPYSSFPNRLKSKVEKYIEWLKTNPTANYPG